MSEIKVISGDKDGRELRREKRGRYLVCDGTADDAEINEALASTGRKNWSIPARAWERIFGGRG